MNCLDSYLWEAIILEIHPYYLGGLRCTSIVTKEFIDNMKSRIIRRWVLNLPLVTINEHMSKYRFSFTDIIECSLYYYPQSISNKLYNSVDLCEQAIIKGYKEEDCVIYAQKIDASTYKTINLMRVIYLCYKYNYMELLKSILPHFILSEYKMATHIYSYAFGKGPKPCIDYLLFEDSFCFLLDIEYESLEDYCHVLAICLNICLSYMSNLRIFIEGIQDTEYNKVYYSSIYRISYNLAYKLSKSQVNSILDKLGMNIDLPEKKEKPRYITGLIPSLWNLKDYTDNICTNSYYSHYRPDLWIQIPDRFSKSGANIICPYYKKLDPYYL